MDDAPFIVNILAVQQQAVGPVVEDPQAGVDGTGHLHGHGVDIVHGLVNGRVGVQVGTELHSDALQVLDQAVAGEGLRAVEAHMLQEVGKTPLVLLFEDGADFLGNVEVGLVFRVFVVTDVVGQSVVKLADADGGIHRDRRHLLG